MSPKLSAQDKGVLGFLWKIYFIFPKIRKREREIKTIKYNSQFD